MCLIKLKSNKLAIGICLLHNSNDGYMGNYR